MHDVVAHTNHTRPPLLTMDDENKDVHYKSVMTIKASTFFNMETGN